MSIRFRRTHSHFSGSYQVQSQKVMSMKVVLWVFKCRGWRWQELVGLTQICIITQERKSWSVGPKLTLGLSGRAVLRVNPKSLVANLWHACCSWLFVINEHTKRFAISVLSDQYMIPNVGLRFWSTCFSIRKLKQQIEDSCLWNHSQQKHTVVGGCHLVESLQRSHKHFPDEVCLSKQMNAGEKARQGIWK